MSSAPRSPARLQQPIVEIVPIDERSLIDGLDHRLWGDGAGRPPISLLARLVAALAHHRTGAPGAGLDADALFARG